MQEPSAQEPNFQSPEQLGGETYIGFAVVCPSGATLFTERILSGAAQVFLRRAGVKWESWGGTSCATYCLIIVALSGSRQKALTALKSGLTELGISDFSVIGFFDDAELIWRTVHPAAGNFAFFVSEPQISLARAERQNALAQFQIFLSYFERIKENLE